MRNIATTGEMLREQVFWEAVAAYLNSGGDIEATASLLHRLASVPDVLMPVGIAEGYCLLSTGHVWFESEDEARQRVEHIFVNPDTEDAVHWVEDVLLEATTMQELAEEDGGDPFDET